MASERKPPTGEPESGQDEGSLLGKRYEDGDTGLEVLCVKPGAGSVGVDGRLLTLKAAKALPSSD